DHHDANPVADDLVSVLHRPGSPDVETHARVELEGTPSGRRLGVAKHHADLFVGLDGEDGTGPGPAHDARELAEGLTHEAGLQPDVGIAQLALDLGAGDESGHRIDDHDIDGARLDHALHDGQSLLAGIRLRDQELVHVDADLARVFDVEGVLHVDEERDPPGALDVGHHLEAEGRLADGFRTEDLDDSPPE